MYSSFESNLTLQSRKGFRDVSFSSYLNKAEENMIRNLTTNQALDASNDHHFTIGMKEEEDEIGVFGAEKYFKEEIEDGENKIDRRFVENIDTTIRIHHQEKGIEEFGHGFSVKQGLPDQINMHTPSVRSNVSCNSRSGLLANSKQASGKKSPNQISKGSKTRIFLARFGCNCIDTKSTQIRKKKFIQATEIANPHTKMFDYDKKTDPFSSKLAVKNTRNDCFTFPVLNSNDLNSLSSSNSKSGNSAGRDHGDNNGGRLSLGRKLSLLNDWDVDVPMEDEIYIPSSRMYNDDVDSDSSSDLFEIESFSTNGNSSFLPHRKSESNCYAPSEVSIDWSVVTASAADFSVFSDYEDVHPGGGDWRDPGGKAQVTENKEEQKKRPGILSGCTNHKAVRVAGDEYKVSGGGPGGRLRRSSESMAVGSVFGGMNNWTRFDPRRGNYGSDICPISESKGRHASPVLYVRQ